MSTKQVILIRNDLGMSAGKIAAQAAHASIAFLTSRMRFPMADTEGVDYGLRLTYAERSWVAGSFAKVALEVWSQDHLESIVQDARAAGLEVQVIEDEGRTVFNGKPTITCAAIGPDYDDKINAVTGHLRLFRKSR